jgi:hypothetical protein
MDQVVDNHNILQIFVRNYSQILYEKTIVGLHAIFPVHNTENRFLLLIQIVYNGLSIVLCSCSENINVVNFAHGIQKLKAMRPDIKFELISFKSELDVSFLIGEYGMNQGLV